MYTDLRNTIDKLNKDKSHFANSNDICTPMTCVEEMVDKIPKEFWNRENISVLDPCAGNGNFPAYILQKVKNNFTITANEISDSRVANLENLIGNNVTITRKDFLKDTFEEGYDLIIANPPYALFNGEKRAAKNHNVSRDFIKIALELLNDNGYLVFIIPDNWMSLSDRNDVVKRLSKYQFVYLDIHGAKKYFPGVGSSFTWFVLKKEENNKPFEINNTFKKKVLSSASLDVGSESIPLFYTDEVKSILDKTIYSNNEKFKIETSSDLHKYTKKDLLSTEKNDVFRYEVIHTPRQRVYSKRPHKFQEGCKVYVILTTYYSTFVECDKGMTQSIAFLRARSLEESKKISKALNHPLYVFINNIHRYGNFNNIRVLQKFPVPNDFNDVWNSFNITKDERNFIMSFLDL